jgi:aminoglycoside 6-adenylyltransferase
VSEAGEYYRRGARVIVDKDALAERLLGSLPATAPATAPPSADDFAACVGHFWFVAVWMAKHLRRGELWRTLGASGQGELMPALLRMIEWHTHAERGWDLDTWEDGRFIEEWADQRVLTELHGVLSRYDGGRRTPRVPP